MAQSNYGALTEGLKLYTDAMRRLIRELLSQELGDNWLDRGVLKELSAPQANGIRRSMKKEPDRQPEDYLDANHFPTIIAKRPATFERLFPNFRQTQSLLNLAAEARNMSSAHSRSGDIPPDDAGNALHVMIQLLERARLPEAEQLDALRKQVQMIEMGESPPAAADSTPLAPSIPRTSLPYWWEACEPREGFRDPGHVDEGLFAATLGGVFAGSARDEYLSPERFLSQTYFTENLTLMLRDVLSRMNGGGGAAVTEVQTPFGGGKTHALLTLYHIINSPAVAQSIDSVSEAMGDLGVPDGAQVLVFDGQEVGADTPVNKEDFASVSTLWGELGHQAGCWSLVQESDGGGTAPGNSVYRQVLEQASPCLILLDELVSYLVKLKFSTRQRPRNLYRQTVQFLQDFLQLAGNVPGVCVLISLPKSTQEFGGLDPKNLQNELGILEELQPRADRVVSKRTPVNDEEIYSLTRRRLFQHVDRSAANQVASAYRSVYERTPSTFDGAVTSADYLQRMEESYPLHPELLDVIYKKWSTASDFPRTRATLQLLASVVADQWRNKRESHMIQPAHVDLERERIRTRIVSAAGAGGGFDGVVAADIIGGDGHANREDERRGGEYKTLQVSRGVATTLLMHSFGGLERSGATIQELRLGSVAPNLGPEYVSEVLTSLDETLWYVHREGDKYRFQTKANIYRIIAENASIQPRSAVEDRLREEVEKAIGSESGFRSLPWAATDDQIADNADPSIAVLAPRFAVSNPEGDGPPGGYERITELWERAGGGFREWRNSLILVAPDQELWERASESVREVLAYQSVRASNLDNLSELEKRDLDARQKDKDASLTTSVTTAYRWLFYPSADGLELVALPIPATANERITARIVDRLKSQDYGDPKVLTGVSAIYFNAKIASDLWKDETEPLALDVAHRRFRQWTYLPILPNRDTTLRDCIREGIASNLWAVVIGDPEAGRYQQLVETTPDFDSLATLFDGSASLVKGEMLELIREELGSKDRDVPGSDEPATQRQVRESKPGEEPLPTPEQIPLPPRRLSRLRLSINDLSVAKTNNLQPYLFKVLQEQDAGAEIQLTIQVSSDAGIGQDVLEGRIVEGFDQLGIAIDWAEE